MTHSVLTKLHKMLRQHQIPATWSMARPADSPLLEQLLAQRGHHEIALLGDPRWISPAAGRTGFARQLSSCLSEARHAGVRISTLALRGTDLSQNFDLLVKHRISVIRGRPDQLHGGGARFRFAPRSVRFGVWYAPVSHVLPRTNAWMPTRWLWRRMILAACKQSGFIQLAVNPAALTENPQGLKDFDLALRASRRLQQDGLIKIRTLHQLAHSLTRTPAQAPQRSILRSA